MALETASRYNYNHHGHRYHVVIYIDLREISTTMSQILLKDHNKCNLSLGEIPATHIEKYENIYQEMWCIFF